MIALDLLAAHMVGDYILQTDWMARNKHNNLPALFIHCAMYCLPFALLLGLYEPEVGPGGMFLAFLFISHVVIDHRRWASGDEWPPKPILVDQSLHLVVLAALARLLQ